MLTCDKCWRLEMTSCYDGIPRIRSRNFDVHGKNDFTRLPVNRFQCSLNGYDRHKYFYMSLNSSWNLSWNDDFATGLSRSNCYAIFSVNRYAYCVWLFHKYEAHMKGLPICFSKVQVKNDVTDNNNKHFVTAFEGECRNIIELREHLKLCFLIILARVVSRPSGRLSVASIYGIYIV